MDPTRRPDLPRGDQAPAAARARALNRVGRHREAATLLRRALATAPDDVDLLCLLAYTLLRADQPREALAVADRAAAAGPREEWAHELRAGALLRLERVRDAMRAAKVAVGLAPESFDAHLALANVHARARNWLGSRREAALLLQLEPDNHLAWQIEGQRHLQAGRLARAEAAFRRGLALEPVDNDLRILLAMTLAQAGRDADAQELLHSAIRDSPESRYAQRSVALYAAQEKFYAALALILAVLCLPFWLLLAANGVLGYAPLAAMMAALNTACLWLAFRFGRRYLRRRRAVADVTRRFLHLHLRSRPLHVWLKPAFYGAAVVVGSAIEVTVYFALGRPNDLQRGPELVVLGLACALMLGGGYAVPWAWRTLLLPRVKPG